MIFNENYGFKDRKIDPESLTNRIKNEGKTEMALGIDVSWMIVGVGCKLERS